MTIAVTEFNTVGNVKCNRYENDVPCMQAATQMISFNNARVGEYCTPHAEVVKAEMTESAIEQGQTMQEVTRPTTRLDGPV